MDRTLSPETDVPSNLVTSHTHGRGLVTTNNILALSGIKYTIQNSLESVEL